MSNDIVKVARDTGNAPKSLTASQSVAFSHYNHISAQLPVDPLTGEIVVGDIEQQARQCLANISAIVQGVDHVMDDVVKLTIFLKNVADITTIDDVYTTSFQTYLPARTIIAVAALPMDALVQIEALVSNGEGTGTQDPCDIVKVARSTENAPARLSSQSVAFSHYNHLSAQLPLDSKTGELIAGGAREQTTQCLDNIEAILKSMDHDIDDVVKVTVFLTDLSDLEIVNEVCARFFPAYRPAQTIVNVSALPMNALVQIDTIVSHGDGTPPQLPEDSRLLVIEANDTENAPKHPYSHSVAFSHYNHISGQLPIDPKTNELIAGGVEQQADQCLKNIKAIVESVDHVMDDVVKVAIFLKDISDIEAVDEIYTTFFESDLPARTVVGVSALHKDAVVQIDAVVSNCEGTPPQA